MRKFVWLLVLPLVAAIAVTWHVAAATNNGTCPPENPLGTTVLLPNPEDCSSYFSCSNGVAILLRCPDGLHFNPELDVCDWPNPDRCK